MDNSRSDVVNKIALGWEASFNDCKQTSVCIVRIVVALLISAWLYVPISGWTQVAGQSTFEKAAPQLALHLQRLFENKQIQIQTKDDKWASVLLNGKIVANVEADDKDFFVTFDVPRSVVASTEKTELVKIERYLNDLLGATNIRIDGSDKDDLDVYAGKEDIGSLTIDTARINLTMVVFAKELPKTAAMVAAAIEPVDPVRSTYFSRAAGISIYDSAGEDSNVVGRLIEDQRVKVIGKTKNSSLEEERWFQIESPDAKPRFVLGKNLLSEKSKTREREYKSLAQVYPVLIDQLASSKGALAKFAGFYSLGPDCSLRPLQVPALPASSQRLQDLDWATTSAVMWTDGDQFFRAPVETGKIFRYKPTFLRAMKWDHTGVVQIYRLERIDPPGADADFAITGFAENGKLLVNVELDGSKIRHRWITRCNNLPNVRAAVKDYYKTAIGRLPTEN